MCALVARFSMPRISGCRHDPVGVFLDVFVRAYMCVWAYVCAHVARFTMHHTFDSRCDPIGVFVTSIYERNGVCPVAIFLACLCMLCVCVQSHTCIYIHTCVYTYIHGINTCRVNH